jgi:hypothetical protein
MALDLFSLVDGVADHVVNFVRNPTLTTSQALECFSAAVSIAGAEMLSRKNRLAPWGWAAWLLGNITFLAFALMNHFWALLVMQIWFMRTSLRGIQNYLIPTLSIFNRSHPHVEHNETIP